MLYDKKWDKKVELDEISQVLLKAADWLEKNSWCQNKCMDEKGARCAYGALYHTSMGISEPSTIRVGNYLFKTKGWDLGLVNWNDQPGRTKEEVIQLLREAAYSDVVS